MSRSRHRPLHRRLTRPLRRLSRLQWLLVAVMTAAVVGGSAALVLVLHGPAPQPAYAAAAPPLALGPDGPERIPQHSQGFPLTTRLVIPAGGIDIPVIQGDGIDVPMHLAVHYPGTDQPGQGSNALYYAHAQPGMFQGLYRLHPGDEIRAVRADGTEIRYRVTAIKKVAYDDRSVLAPTAFDEITLLTCTSYDPYTPRLIVIGTAG